MGKTQSEMMMMMIARGSHSISLNKFRYSFFFASNIQCRPNSYSASLPSSDTLGTKLSKHERRAMVESFVNNYREMNGGKFPSATFAQKQVGGSYYTVRKIIQELQYNSKMSSTNKTPFIKHLASHSILVAEKSYLLKGDALVSPCLEKPEDDKEEEAQKNHLLKEETDDVCHPCLEISEKLADDKKDKAQHNDFDFVPAESHLLKEETEDVSNSCLEISRDVEKEEAQGDHSGFAETENHLLVGETEEVLHPCLEKAEDNKEKQAVYEDLPNVDGLGSKGEQDQGSIELDKNVKDVSSRQTNDAEVPKKSSLWGNLKSFADGIINIWRKK